MTVEKAAETAGTTLLDVGASALLAVTYLASPGSGGANNSNDTIQGVADQKKKDSPAPAAAAGGGFKRPRSGSGKEKATDVPSWAQGQRPKTGENGKQFAQRLLDSKYGAGQYKTGPGTEFNKIQKWGDRGFE